MPRTGRIFWACHAQPSCACSMRRALWPLCSASTPRRSAKLELEPCGHMWPAIMQSPALARFMMCLQRWLCLSFLLLASLFLREWGQMPLPLVIAKTDIVAVGFAIAFPVLEILPVFKEEWVVNLDKQLSCLSQNME